MALSAPAIERLLWCCCGSSTRPAKPISSAKRKTATRGAYVASRLTNMSWLSSRCALFLWWCSCAWRLLLRGLQGTSSLSFLHLYLSPVNSNVSSDITRQVVMRCACITGRAAISWHTGYPRSVTSLDVLARHVTCIFAHAGRHLPLTHHGFWHVMYLTGGSGAALETASAASSLTEELHSISVRFSPGMVSRLGWASCNAHRAAAQHWRLIGVLDPAFYWRLSDNGAKVHDLCLQA